MAQFLENNKTTPLDAEKDYRATQKSFGKIRKTAYVKPPL